MEIYIDDILIVSDDEKEHVKVVKEVLKRIRMAGLKVNIKKTELMTHVVEFLGFWISVGNRGVTQSIKERINQLKKPQTVREVQQLMGIMGYIQDIIPGYSQMAKPIYAAKKVDV